MASGGYSEKDCSVFVGNLDSRVTEEILWELFLQAGPLENVRIPTDKNTGQQRSFGFVEFSSPVSVHYASELLDGIRLYDRAINVKPQSNNQDAAITPNRQSPLLLLTPKHNGRQKDLENSFERPEFRRSHSQPGQFWQQAGAQFPSHPGMFPYTPEMVSRGHPPFVSPQLPPNTYPQRQNYR